MRARACSLKSRGAQSGRPGRTDAARVGTRVDNPRRLQHALSPRPARIKHWLEAGVVGEVLSARLRTGSYLPAWKPQQDYRASYSASPEYGGAILDCIHELDLACWLLGRAGLHSALVRPAAALGLQTDGLAELLLVHESGAISNVHLNFVQRDYRRSIEIIGSEGTLAWDFQAGEAVHFGANGAVTERVRQPADWNVNQMYQDELAYFLHCAQTACLPSTRFRKPRKLCASLCKPAGKEPPDEYENRHL